MIAINGIPPRLAQASALLAALTWCTSAPAVPAGPFESFAGRWQGGGTITLGDGSREPIRCKASYAVGSGADALSIDVDCASDSYRVRILSHVEARGGGFSGTWQEVTRQVQGDITGRIPAPGEMQADLQALGVAMQLSARAEGARQQIALRVQGADVQAVDITLRRG